MGISRYTRAACRRRRDNVAAVHDLVIVEEDLPTEVVEDEQQDLPPEVVEDEQHEEQQNAVEDETPPIVEEVPQDVTPIDDSANSWVNSHSVEPLPGGTNSKVELQPASSSQPPRGIYHRTCWYAAHLTCEMSAAGTVVCGELCPKCGEFEKMLDEMVEAHWRALYFNQGTSSDED